MNTAFAIFNDFFDVGAVMTHKNYIKIKNVSFFITYGTLHVRNILDHATAVNDVLAQLQMLNCIVYFQCSIKYDILKCAVDAYNEIIQLTNVAPKTIFVTNTSIECRIEDIKAIKYDNLWRYTLHMMLPDYLNYTTTDYKKIQKMITFINSE